METFRVGLGDGFWLRLAGRSPLVRGSDRVEAWLYLFAVLVVVIATPIAGAIGTSVHETRSTLYAEAAGDRYLVEARAVGDGYIKVLPGDVQFFARTAWNAFGRDHTGEVEWSQMPEVNDTMNIWVDAEGNRVSAVSPESRAGVAAVGIALSMWYGVVIVVAGLVARDRLIEQRAVNSSGSKGHLIGDQRLHPGPRAQP